MKTIAKKKRILTADEIAEEAMAGKDISHHFTGNGKMMPGIQRVNVDFTKPMLKELDDLVVELNISRQALIKTFVRECLDRHNLAVERKHLKLRALPR